MTQPTPKTVGSEDPSSDSGRCSTARGASVLQSTTRHGAQVARPSPDATWGLHSLDANIALGNLVSIVRRESSAFARHR